MIEAPFEAAIGGSGVSAEGVVFGGVDFNEGGLAGEPIVVAVGFDGEEHVAIDRDGGGVNNMYQLTAEFDRHFEKIREYRLQTRPYERVEIPGIALKPAAAG